MIVIFQLHFHKIIIMLLSNGRDFIAYNLLYGLNKQVIKANEAFILNDMNNKRISIFLVKQPMMVVVYLRVNIKI